MNTVEELNGTYFYAGKSNLKASELFFMIFCENNVDQLGLGVADFGAVVALFSGINDQKTRAKPKGAKEGTSRASKSLESCLKLRNFHLG